LVAAAIMDFVDVGSYGNRAEPSLRLTESYLKIRSETSEQPTDADAAEATSQLRAEHRQETSLLQRAVDRLTALVGLPGFVAVLTIAIVLWITSNMLAIFFGFRAADPPPFVWLQGSLTTGALYVATLILTTQRREEKLSSQRGQLLLELAILNDQKSSKMIKLLVELRRDNPLFVDRIDEEARTMSSPLNHRSVMGAIKNQ
jgi:uncharacterized membrane protein